MIPDKGRMALVDIGLKEDNEKGRGILVKGLGF